jgi:hypothetical protein
MDPHANKEESSLFKKDFLLGLVAINSIKHNVHYIDTEFSFKGVVGVELQVMIMESSANDNLLFESVYNLCFKNVIEYRIRLPDNIDTRTFEFDTDEKLLKSHNDCYDLTMLTLN